MTFWKRYLPTLIFALAGLLMLPQSTWAQDDDIIEAGEQENEVVTEGEDPPDTTATESTESTESTEVATPETTTESGADEITAGEQKKSKKPFHSPLRISGFVDIGFFMAMNNGVGFTKDTTATNHSGHVGEAAGVFLGDYMSTMINSRNDVADQGEAKHFMRDPIQSGGGPSFILNELYVNLVKDLTEEFRFTGSFALAPRTHYKDGTASDMVELDQAFLEYKPFEDLDITASAGKFASIVGIEYRWRKAPDRWGVTPSLLSRYTDGTPVGVKVRGKHLDKRLIYNVGMTNGSNFIDSTKLNDDIETNSTQTGSARVSYDFWFGPFSLFEVGVSGEYGAQSKQIDRDVVQMTRGVDLQMAAFGAELRGQFLRLDVDGGGIEDAKSYKGYGFYVEALYGLPQFFDSIQRIAVYARYGQRKVDELDDKYIFIVDVMRITPGIRIDVNESVIFKAEYVLNLEKGVVPSFANDVFTTSLVAKF